MGIFETAVFDRYRYNSPKGNLTTEDLCDLPLTSKNGICLDSIAKSLNKRIKETEEDSFVHPKNNTTSKELETKLEIVKHIIKVRLDAAEAKVNAREAKIQRENIMNLIAGKKNEELQNKSIEELEAMLKN